MVLFRLFMVFFICLLSYFTYAVEPASGSNASIYVINNGWHTGLVLPATALKQFPELKQRFGDVPYLEMGWGDKGFYQERNVTAGIAIRAMLGISGSIIHLVAVPYDPKQYFKNSQIKEICLSSVQLQRLSQNLAQSFDQSSGSVSALGKGLYGDSEFYAALGAYHLFNTCNSWTAQQLASLDLPIWPYFKLTASSVMNAIAALPEQCQ
ncbi:TIGR02117 family protein [Iodobacter ciconiae]|uniref:TIGR02117 family protein n=1 Tax=Iodobacter ciconiae TaxID=2496266 RepID=UPI0013DF2C91|nr:TIGR02117 family protein [Iodobacter ciconiae]